ncbi:RNA polymerase sigma-I factor [Clostridium sp. SHJSY1]|uniref:RNA polymerase sigma-I factor n=1 Tax=Clostridium sp. SHJSY1 TaxID=2942483 RepID=UPI0028762B2A|nr:RNA polymerase sigma-I factor [Clostridium sp. SHJSY1]MDS0528232.1 RNA polymerase sigma-I factor [Clostridium sp. SHJSY1]
MREIDELVIKAQKDKNIHEKLINENEFFIIKIASRVVNKYITKSDDEWSIALNAFNETIKSYDLNKGSFYSFAEIVIKRRMIDYLRKESKHKGEISVDSYVFQSNSKDNEETEALNKEVIKKISEVNTETTAKMEIEEVTEKLNLYGFSFYDLIKVSPKSEKTKNACARAVAYILKNSIVNNELIESKKLPIKIIEKNIKVPRKVLERHRKYIIAAVVIMSGDYPHLAEYMHFIREELTR